VFFSHNKSVISTFSHDFTDKQTDSTPQQAKKSLTKQALRVHDLDDSPRASPSCQQQGRVGDGCTRVTNKKGSTKQDLRVSDLGRGCLGHVA
jgi:hypothetical protein